MKHTTLIVPGYRGSGDTHWQTWLEARLPNARRVTDIDWDTPRLFEWTNTIRAAIHDAPNAVWIVAHSFGCLASLVAASSAPDKTAGALLVAPADPERFVLEGIRPEGDRSPGLSSWLPQRHLGFPSAVVASLNDPWLKLMVAAYWAERWGSRLVNAGLAGHINIESGYGPWPDGLTLLESMQAPQSMFLLGDTLAA